MGRKRQTTIRRIRGGAVAAILAGLFLFDLHAVRRKPPVIHIGEIAPFMNFATVQVEGLLLADAKRLRSGAIYYWMTDGTGSLPVFLEKGGPNKLPLAGSRVSVTGQLSVGAGNQVRLRVHLPDGVKLLEDADPIRLKGLVAEVRMPPPGSNAPCKLFLITSNGTWEIVHWFEPDTPIAVGDTVEVEGSIGSYKGRLQVEVRDPADLRHQSDG